MCKAVSDIGMAITKAKLQVFKVGEKIKKVKAKDVKEKVVKEIIEETIITGDIVPISKVHKEKAVVTMTEAESIQTTDTASYKKADKKQPVKPQSQQIEPSIKLYDYLESSQQQDEEIADSFEPDQIDKHFVIMKRVESDNQMVAEVNELLEVINAKEFGPGESPLRELAKIGYMLRNGITTQQIESLYDSKHFPALIVPQSQSALVQLVERQGHGALITQILTEETAQDETVVAAKAGFRAFLRMVEMKHSSVEEVIAHFYPEDFKPRSWEQKEAREVSI